jgi:hypothetical protein
MIEESTALFIVSFIFGFIGNEIGHRIKEIKRSTNSKIAVGFIGGFGASLLTLIITTKLDAGIYIAAIVIGLVYGVIMANGKAFEDFK